MKIRIMLVLTFALVFTACSTSPARIQNSQAMAGDFEEYLVTLEAIDGALAVSPPQGDDAAGKKNGWVGFEQGKYGTIRFAMAEYPEKTECTDDPETSAEWVLTEVVLSKFGNKSEQKGENFGELQQGWIAHAFPTLSEDGYLVNESVDTAQTSAVLIDVNNNGGQQMAFYRIEVQRCDGTGEPLKLDPGILNGGRR